MGNEWFLHEVFTLMNKVDQVVTPVRRGGGKNSRGWLVGLVGSSTQPSCSLCGSVPAHYVGLDIFAQNPISPAHLSCLHSVPNLQFSLAPQTAGRHCIFGRIYYDFEGTCLHGSYHGIYPHPGGLGHSVVVGKIRPMRLCTTNSSCCR